MTDLSSEPDEREAMANMAGELIHTKMEMAKRETQLTNVLRIGTFHMEIIPSKEIDIKEMFTEILDTLIDKYGDKLLEISLPEGPTPDGRHYG